MYFESAFYRVNHLSTMENEELKEFLKKAADKCNTAPESFYIYPTCITDEKVFDTKVTMGQKVKKGNLLTVMDLDGVERHQCQKTVITIVTNYNSYTDIAQVKTGSITSDDIIMELSLQSVL